MALVARTGTRVALDGKVDGPSRRSTRSAAPDLLEQELRSVLLLARGHGSSPGNPADVLPSRQSASSHEVDDPPRIARRVHNGDDLRMPSGRDSVVDAV